MRIGKLMEKSPDGKLTNHHTSVRNQSGDVIPIRLTATWLKDAVGNRLGSVGYFEDLREIKEMERRLELLLQASNTITQTNNLDAALNQLARMLVRQLDVGVCRIFLLAEESPLLMLKAAVHRSKGRNHRYRSQSPRLSDSVDIEQWPTLAYYLAKSGPQLIGLSNSEAVLHLDEWRRCLRLDANIHSLFLIPLYVRERTVGLLCLGDTRPLNEWPFHQERTNLAIAIADQTAVLIDQMHLLELTEFHRQLLMTLDEASRSIRAEKKTDKLLREIVRLAVQLVGFNVGGLYKHDPHQGTLELIVT
jgi:GAF domain-containing protein